ncbi:translocation/assembly module TamB domain-containing protein [Crenalkalicoccus roseus]|uniref:translocation/assembly module TamB domain-containing protein n=1 Tax=Crenalkalicoccus roseus TaxID=1485588 RepID=UPI00107FD8BD|nr:translocation/assembly module TamB domain-containing protein [Crenalkalicoccus roseus]
MRRRLALLLVLLLPLTALGVAAQDRQDRPGFLERRLEALVPGLRVEGLSGVWRATPTARRITLSDHEGVWLSLEAVRLSIAPTALLRGVLRFELLEAERVRVARLPRADPAAPAPAPAPADPQAGVLPALPRLPVDLALERLAVERLELEEAVLGQAAAFAATGAAALESDRFAADLALRRLDAEGSATVDIALVPAEDRLRAEVVLREPPGGLAPTLLGLAEHPLTLDLRLAGPAAGADLSLQAALGPEIAVEAQGVVRALADGSYGAQLAGEARAAPLLPAEYAGLASPARFALDAERPAAGPLALRRLDLEVPAGSAAVTGTLDIAREVPDLTIRLALAEAARFAGLLPTGLGWEAVRAEARVTGTLAAPRIRLEAAPQGLATGVAQADAVLGPAPLLAGEVVLPGPRLDLAVQGAEGRLALAGTLAEPVDLAARLSLPRLEVLGAGSEGALEAEARAQGALADPGVTIAARSARIAAAGRVLEGLVLNARIESPASAPRAEADLAATLDGQPLGLVLRGLPEGTLLRLEQAEARFGPARLAAAGLLDPQALLFDGTARLDIPALAPLAPLAGLEGLQGRLAAEARLAPRDGAQGFDVTLEAPSLAYGGVSGRLRAAAQGTPQALGWSLQANAEQGALSGRGRLEAANGGWRADLAALQAEAMGETLRLAAPARVTLEPGGGIALGQTTLALARGGRAQAAGRWGPERADLTVTLSAIPAALAGRFLPGMEPRGSLNGTVRVTGPVAQPEVRATLAGTGLQPGAPWAAGLPAIGLRAEASLTGGAAEAQAVVELGAAGRVTATARLPQGFGAEAPLAATLDGALTLAPLAGPFLAAGADRVTGRLALALRAGGTLGDPQLGGTASLSGVEYRNPVHGVRISDINGTLAAEGTRLVIQRLQGRTPGNGTIALQGGVDLGAEGLPADLTLTARNARPVVSDLLTATLDADLRLDGPVTGGGLLAGQVRVQRAEIRVPDRIPASVPVLEGVRVRGTPPPGAILPPEARPRERPPPAAAAPRPPIRLDLTLSAPRAIFVRGRGVDAELGGEVRIAGTADAPVPQGAFTLRHGTLDVLARRLTFNRGTIGFTSGTLTPQLDLAAQSRVRATTITIAVQGTPAEPRITLSSSPELPQDEILARLLFDRPTANLSPFEIAQLAQALGQLAGIGTGPGVMDQLRGALGLDRLGLAAGENGRGPAVEAGRYVAPGVFVGVRQGTQGGRTGVGVEVELTPRLKLEGQTATGPAGERLGLSYEFEW